MLAVLAVLGGVYLVVSWPGAYRVITEQATDEQLAIFGLAQPSMEITLTLTNRDVVETDVGDCTPNGQNYYVRAPNSNAVALVDYTWYDELERQVLDPPYAAPEE